MDTEHKFFRVLKQWKAICDEDRTRGQKQENQDLAEPRGPCKGLSCTPSIQDPVMPRSGGSGIADILEVLKRATRILLG